MRVHTLVAIIIVVLAVEADLQSQVCYSPIASWQANYMLTGAGTGTGSDGFSYTINETSSAAMSTTGGATSCTSASWAGATGTTVTGSVNDAGVNACPGSGQESIKIKGPADFSASIVSIDLSKGTYSYFTGPEGEVTVTQLFCNGGTTTTNGGWPMEPANWPTAPPTFPLPATPQPLTEDLPNIQGTWAWGNVPIPWNFSFTLTPTYTPDDSCHDKANSSIGCQNQSLGEDIPIIGTGFHLHYEGQRAPGAGGNSTASTDAFMIGGWTLSVHHAYDPSSNTLFFGDGGQRNGYQLGTPLRFNGNLLITSENGSEVYVFSGTTGLHIQTLRPLTGALVYQFSYDSNGNLVTVKDATGNVTTIKRDASGHATAIVAPFKQTTTLKVDSNGFLSEVTDPLGKSASFMNTADGLLASRTDENGNAFTYKYDNNGRLSKDADSLGGFISANRTNASSGLGWTVTESTSMGRTSSYQTTISAPWVANANSPFSKQQVNIWPSGLQATTSKSLQNGQITESVALPDTTSDKNTSGPDPVWGIQVPVNTNETLTRGNLTMNITGSRSTTLGTAGNPFTVNTETDIRTVNGRKYTSAFTGSSHSYVNTSPAGRTLTVGLDSLERVASTQVAGLTATDFTYDTRGRLASSTQGTRKTTFNYNTNGFLASVVDPLTLKTSFAYDVDGRITSTTLPDGRIIGYTYDANGNLTSVTPPGKSAHDFAYNAVDLPTSYTPPAVSGTGAIIYGYDLDRNLSMVTRPDGGIINYGYDTAGRLSSIGTPSGTTTLTYDSTTGNLTTAADSSEHIAYSYNGSLLTQSTLTGTVTGSVAGTYNNNFDVISETINGGSAVAFTYDNDGLATKVGALTVNHNAQNGLITTTALGVTTDSRTYNGFGELTGYTASVKGSPVYSVLFTRDNDGRIATKTETIVGVTNTYVYTYDLTGRLTKVKKNATTNSYTYDTNSNRLTGTTSSGTSTGTYDVQDRLLTYGTASYTYTANGELASQTVGTQKTTYQYDVLGNLTAATLPNGTKITYVIDAENHRVGKEVNSTLQAGFLYDGDSILAQLNGKNQLVSRFVYATGSTSPDYMVSGGVTYRIFSDQLGSPVLVVNNATGVVAEQITYDEFGNVIVDTKPGFQPFGFAGGLYDQDTKLVRFGARDYEPSVGRWTAKDPVLFSAGDPNLYGYSSSDPINEYDSSGLDGTNALKLFNENSEAAQASKIASQVVDGAKLANDVANAYVDGTLETFARNKALKETNKTLSENKEVEKVIDEVRKNIPFTERLSNILRDLLNACSTSTAPKSDSEKPVKQTLRQWVNHP